VDHRDHVELLRRGVPAPGGTWADLGSGTGAFTLALAELLGPGGVIHAVDRDAGALRDLERGMGASFPGVTVRPVVGDFTRPLNLPPLDGIVMANSLHFHRDRETVARHAIGWIRPGGRLIVVEYDADTGNPWVPHPFSYRSWVELTGRIGLRDVQLIGRVPSRFLGAIYSAVAVVPEPPPRA
jgi:ubiquinone/menaquinone biosynthesis C-methylase UbiE